MVKRKKAPAWEDECPCCGEWYVLQVPVYDGTPLPCGCGVISADEDGAYEDISGCEIDHDEG